METLHTVQIVHYVALGIMALVYTIRILWFLKFPAGKERQPVTGDGSLKPTASIWRSWFTVVSPGSMESYRKHRVLWTQFVAFHLGVVAAITMSFIIADFAGLMNTGAVVVIFQVLLWAACAVGLMRIVRRFGSKYMRALSSPDDYFSLILLTVWFGLAAAAAPLGVPAKQAGGASLLIAYYGVQTFFLLYVPFSKISHYLYYPFTRYYLGKTLGRRGVHPVSQVRS